MRSTRPWTIIGPIALALAFLATPAPGQADDVSAPPRQQATAARDPRFGIVQAIQSPDLAVAAGASWERIIFPWSTMEPEPDRFNYGYFTDQQIRDQVARGFSEVGVLIYTPAWAAADPRRPLAKSVPRNLDLPWNSPENYWGRFTGRMAARYRGLVDYWIIWNEPDLYDWGSRWFFDGAFEDYYQLLKVAYQSIKANNPRAKVLLAGMAYWYDRYYDRPPYLASLLEVAGRDPSARQNNWYFDIVPVHAYANPLNSYTQPQVMHRILQERGIDKPIWIIESNAVPNDDPKAPTPPGPLRATQVQQASYIIQSYALGLAAGVERQSVYKMVDEIPEDGQYFGLVRNDGSVRPAYQAYKVAATYLSGARWASYSWGGASVPPSDAELEALLASNRGRTQFIWPAALNQVIVERGDRRTTVLWNASPRPLQARVPAVAASGLSISQAGEVATITPVDGAYALSLPPTSHNADPSDPGAYLIGGLPTIIDEPVAPLPRRIRSRISMVWPHGWAPVEQANQANVTAQLLERDEDRPVPCRWEPRVLLWATVDHGFRELMGVGRRQLVREGGVQYPVWQFDNVPVGPARTGSFMTFSVTVDGIDVTPETWVYGGQNATPAVPLDPLSSACQ